MNTYILMNSWAKIQVEYKAGKYVVVHSEQPTLQELTDLLNDPTRMVFDEDGFLVNKNTMQPYTSFHR